MIWLLTRDRVKWATGPMDRFFAFLCAQCGATTPAMVRTQGFGAGRNLPVAQQRAQASADAFAYQAVAAAACPCCGALQPSFHEGVERVRKRVARRHMLRIPVAAVAALVIAILIGIPALRDLRHSIWLSVAAVSASAAVGALFFRFMSGHVAVPSTNPMGVWFSQDPTRGPQSWFPARGGNAAPIEQSARLTLVLSLVSMVVTGITATIAVIAWQDTFRDVYVVSAEGEGHDLSVAIDGAAPIHLSQSGNADAPSTKLEVRTDAKHHVVVSSARGGQLAYDLDPAVAKHGWAIAPHGRDRGLCLASITWSYGTKPKEGDDALLNENGEDLVVLPRSFDKAFTEPPATVQVDQGSSATRTSLRALACSSLAHEAIVPFKNAPNPARAPAPSNDDDQ
jgi:hypothetical protein